MPTQRALIGGLAVLLLGLVAPSLGGDWCENFEKGLGEFWAQPESQGGEWQARSYKNETAHGKDVPKPPSGEDGMLLLEPWHQSLVAWSMLVSPEMQFSEDATIQLDYWLWYNVTSPSPMSFMLFRRINGVQEEYAFVNISSFANVYQSQWASITAFINGADHPRMQIAVYGYVAGEVPEMSSNLGIDRIILHGVNGDNDCGGNSTIPPTVSPPTITPPQPAPTTTPRPPDFFCPAPYGLFLDVTDCHYFFQCSAWTPYRMACPADLAYNPYTKRCDYRSNVFTC